MANSKLIVVEGAQGAGKTSITDFLRYSMPSTNLYRLSGTSDTSPTGRQKSEDMYNCLMYYIKKMENKNINLVFDRTFFTEENYCRLGLKDYKFTDIYERLLEEFSKLDFEIYYITLYLKDENLYEERLDRDGKVSYKASQYKKENSIKQQKVYLEMAEEIRKRYSKTINVLNVANDGNIMIAEEEIRKFVNF